MSAAVCKTGLTGREMAQLVSQKAVNSIDLLKTILLSLISQLGKVKSSLLLVVIWHNGRGAPTVADGKIS